MQILADNGTRFQVRAIRPDDKPLLSAALSRLSPETVRRRFLTAKPRFSSSELRYLTEVDGHDHVALVVTAPRRPDEIVAVGRFVRLIEDPGTAEFAIVVGDRFQRRGLGRRLAEMLAEEAQAVGIHRFTATTLSDNVAVDRLVATIAQRLTHAPAAGGTREMVAELAA